MKASDLAIGDLFLYNGNTVEVVSIDGGTGTAWIDGKKVSALRKIDDLQPIPLTPEIIEKNGFERSKVFVEWKYEKDDVYILWKPFPWIDIEYGECSIKFPCEYIHQFQRALRLCGIEKQIEL